jgi:hypothetical protein
MKRLHIALVFVTLLGLSLGIGPVSSKAPRSTAITPLHEVSYYPRNYAWEAFWPNWALVKPQMDVDLDRIQALGANTVRIFLHPAAMGYPVPSAAMLANFEDALKLIAAHGLKAHVNLFDCADPYNDISGSQTWLSAVVAPHKNDARIAIWELRNEVDLGNPVVRTWVQQMFPYLKEQAGTTWATISVSNVEWLDDVIDLTGSTQPDLYSLHWYPQNDLFWTRSLPATLDSALLVVSKEKLLLGEFGLSTYDYSDNSQVNLYNNVLYDANERGITNLGQWTLNDFPVGTTQCSSHTPPPQEWYFGIYNEDTGIITEKPAAAVLRDDFNGKPPTIRSLVYLYNPSFEALNPYSNEIENWWHWDSLWTGQSWDTRDCTVARSGNCSVRLQGPGDKAVGMFSAPAIQVDPSLRYTLSGYVKTQKLNGWAHLVLSWFDAAGVWLGQTTSPDLTTSDQGSWTYLSIGQVQPPTGAAYAQVFVQMNSTDPEGKVWFDDIRLYVMQVFLPIIRK